MRRRTSLSGAVRTDRPNVARMYDFLLGGKDNFAADREAAREVMAACPELADAAHADRRFLRRAVRYLAIDCGVTQFLDLGTGLPTMGHLHEVLREIGLAGRCRIVYVDDDAVVGAHVNAVIGHMDGTAFLAADLRDPARVLTAGVARRILDMSRPIGVLMTGVLHFLTDGEDPAGLIGGYMTAVPPGSYLVLSHDTNESDVVVQAFAGVYKTANHPMIPRAPQRIEEMVERSGVALLPVDPGLVSVTDWHAGHPAGPGRAGTVRAHGGVYRKVPGARAR